MIWPVIGKDRRKLTIFIIGEIELLVGHQLQLFRYQPVRERRQAYRAFRDNHHVGTVALMRGFTQTPHRQQRVIIYRTAVIHQKDVHLRLDVPVLESVVEQYELSFRKLPHQFLDSSPAALAHGNLYPRAMFEVNLERLVTDAVGGAVGIGKNESPCLPFVATAQHSDIEGG